MSDIQNENQNSGTTIKPIVQKTSLRINRSQTEGYQKDESIESNSVLQTKPTLQPKPSLNLSASVYIPKSLTSNNANASAANTTTTDKTSQPAVTPSVQSNVLNANTQSFTPKMSNYNSNVNMTAPINPMGQNYNIGQMNPSYNPMYTVPNMGMINSNSMIGYTYLNQNYQNYHSQPPSGYNSYIGNTPSNKFASNQFYGTNQNQVQPQIYNNMYQNKMSNQIPLNQANQSVPLSTAPLINNINNQTIQAPVQANPIVPNLSQNQNNTPLHKDGNAPSSNTASTTTIKKPINLDAQSFIPKNLKKQSISSEKEALAQTPKKDIAEPQNESTTKSETSETQFKPVTANESVKSESISPIEKVVTPSTESQDKTPKQEESRDSAKKQSPDTFSLDKKDSLANLEEKLQKATVNIEATKPKPKSLLGSILSQPPTATSASKQTEKTVVNVISAPAKKKQNDANKALEEKAKLLREQEKLKKEEKLKEEIKQKQAASVSTPSSTRKADKSARKVSKNEEEANEKENTETKVEEIYKENEEPVSTEKKFTIERIYFKVYVNEKTEDTKNRFSFDYLFSYRNWKICSETKLIEDLVSGHFKELRDSVEETSTMKPQGRGGDNKGGFGKRGTKFRDEPVQPKISNENMTFQRSKIDLKPPEPKETPSTETGEGLGKWGRKDLSKEEKLATDFKSRRQEEISKDPIRSKLTEHLNTITIDNFTDTRINIMDLINLGQENQEKFIEVLFKKAVTEKSYVVIYARLCKEVDRELTPKEENLKSSISGKKPLAKTSVFRTKLLEKCKNVFKNEDQEELSLYVSIKDPEERQQRQKAFLLGNVNFIAEMIINKILSKKVVNQCINNLFARVERIDKENYFMKHVCLEGIVILTDKFGTLVNRQDTKMKTEDQEKFNEDIDGYLNRLYDIQENDKSLPGHIKFKIINLIEKKNKDWEESIVESTRKIKGKDEVREEHELEQRGGSIKVNKGGARLDQDAINLKIKDEMFNWKEYKKIGKNRNFDWSITESILSCKNSIGEVLTAFGENCIDFIGKPEDIDIAYSYIYEILDFYQKNIGEKDKKEIKNTAIFFLSNLNDLILDNILLIDIWGAVIYALNDFKIFGYKDFEELKDLQEDQLKTVFEVVAKSLVYYEEEKKIQLIKSIQEIAIFKNNSSLLNSYVNLDG